MAHSIEELALMIDLHMNQLKQGGLASHADDISRTWLLTKRKLYSGDSYIDQLERNAVYLVEATAFTITGIAIYLQRGEPPHFRSEDIPEFVKQQGKGQALHIVRPIVAFIRGYEA